MKVREFSSEQIWQFAQKWHGALAVKTDNDMDAEEARQKAAKLYHDVLRNSSVFKMAGAPLLMAIIALIHYQGNSLPEKRVSLYDLATSTFLENWVKQRELNKHGRFDKETLIEILSPVSFHIHRFYSTGLIAESELKALLLIEYKKINPGLTAKEQKSDIRDVMMYLREDAGFLFEKGMNEQGEAMFGFIHQTFQEYFAAIGFVSKWKEGAFRENLGDFVFDVNWREVILLAAAIFKLNDNTRIGRLNTSNFVRDILAVKDIFPEIYRPLDVVMAILEDHTEVEFDVFTIITDTVIAKVEAENEYLTGVEIYSRKPTLISGIELKTLFETTAYRTYLLDRFIREIKYPQSSAGLVEALILTLITKTDLLPIKHALIRLLRSDNDVIKWHVFNNGWSYPVPDIVGTKIFREEMFRYINSEGFAKVYKGNLPRQLYLRPRLGDRDYTKEELETKYEELLLDWQISFLSLIENDKIRADLIDMHIRMMNITKIKDAEVYLNRVEREVRRIDINSVKRRIDRYLILLEYDFKFLENLNYVADFDTLLMIMEHDKIRPVFDVLDISNLLNVALDYIVARKNEHVGSLLNWLKGHSISKLSMDKIGIKYRSIGYKDMINVTALPSEDKLLILYLVGDRSDYEHLIDPTIQKFRNSSCKVERRHIRNLLRKVFG